MKIYKKTWSTQGGPGKPDKDPENPKNMTPEQIQAAGLGKKIRPKPKKIIFVSGKD